MLIPRVERTAILIKLVELVVVKVPPQGEPACVALGDTQAVIKVVAWVSIDHTTAVTRSMLICNYGSTLYAACETVQEEEEEEKLSHP